MFITLTKANESGNDLGPMEVNPDLICAIYLGPNDTTELLFADGHTRWAKERVAVIKAKSINAAAAYNVVTK